MNIHSEKSTVSVMKVDNILGGQNFRTVINKEVGKAYDPFVSVSGYVLTKKIINLLGLKSV